MAGLPFERHQVVQVVPPSALSGLSPSEAHQASGIRKLIEEHRAAIERELGGKLEFTDQPDLTRPVWLIGPYECNHEIVNQGRSRPEGPELFLDRTKRLLITDGRNPDEVTETFSYLRSLSLFEGGLWRIQDCQTVDEAIARIAREVGNSFPAFELKVLTAA